MSNLSRSHYITTNACLGSIFSFVICLGSIFTAAPAVQQLSNDKTAPIYAGPLLLLTITRHAASGGYRLVISPHSGLLWLFVGGIFIGGITGYALHRHLSKLDNGHNRQT